MGIGLGFCEGLLKQQDAVVVAAARSPDKSEVLEKLVRQFPDRLRTVVLDTTSETSVKVCLAPLPVACGLLLGFLLPGCHFTGGAW